jgi:hypothetical protein
VERRPRLPCRQRAGARHTLGQPDAPTAHLDVNDHAPASRPAHRLGETIGHGAVARVVRVHGPHGDLAGKILHASHAFDEAAKARFAQEAELCRSLRHDNIVAIEGLVTIEGASVLLMELVDGPSLATLVAREAPLPEATLVAIARGIASGLAAAHRAGVVHRDLKPANVLLTREGVPKIADFGMARATSLSGVESHAMTVLGTPDTMAPESIDPLAVDARTDLYALGCIMHEMATGRPPYSAATPMGVLAAHRRAEVPALPEPYSRALDALCRALLSKSPADRPQAAEAVVTALDAIASGESTALVRPADLEAAGRCGSCGAPRISGVATCLRCGTPGLRLERGDYGVFVVGPGEPGDKLDSTLRQRLRELLHENPQLGIAPSRGLERRIPRLPIVLVTGVDEVGARRFAEALGRRGMVVEVHEGGVLSHPPMRAKVRSLSLRALAIAGTTFASTIGAWQNVWGMAIASVALVAVVVVTAVASVRKATRSIAGREAALPPQLRAAVGRLERALPAIDAARHRDGLRGVVARAVALAPAAKDEDDGPRDPDLDEVDAELARAVDTATAAAARLSELDDALSRADLGDGRPETREILHARDTWASRLAALTSALDALALRRAAARARAGTADDVDLLASLRAHVEALEEVAGPAAPQRPAR